MHRGSGQDTGIVRAKNTGTFDRSTLSWRIKLKRIQVSVRQLAIRYGVTFTGETPAQLEKESTPYWRRFLQDIADDHRQARKAASPLQDRIKSIEAMIVRVRAEQGDTAILERMLTEAINTPADDFDAADIPVVHPAAEHIARLLPLDPDALTVGLLNNLIPTPIRTPDTGSIEREGQVFIEGHRQRGHKGWYQVRQAIELFLTFTGNIRVQDVTVDHFRDYVAAVKAHPTWGQRTQVSQRNTVATFLKGIECDYPGVTYGFVRNKKYVITSPEGRKEQYTPEQVRLALQHATGDVRLALLLGLNCGMYWSDITRLKAEDVIDGHLHYVRKKNDHDKNSTKIRGSYLLWPETAKLLHFNLNVRKMLETYTTWRHEYGLPSHKALRKTVTQVIHEVVKDAEASRLYRAENVAGTHGRSYIRPFTPAQILTLDTALREVGRIYGLLPATP